MQTGCVLLAALAAVIVQLAGDQQLYAVRRRAIGAGPRSGIADLAAAY